MRQQPMFSTKKYDSFYPAVSLFHLFVVKLEIPNFDKYIDSRRIIAHILLLILIKKNIYCRPASSKTDVGEAEGGQTGGAPGATSEASQAHQQHQQFLGDTSLALPAFGSVDTSSQPLPDGVTANDLRTFEKMYKEHAEVLVNSYTWL